MATILQYSCLENSTGRGAWWGTVHGVAKSWTQLKQLSAHTHTHTHSQMLFLSHACVLFVTLRTVAPRLLHPWDSSGKNTGVRQLFPSPGDPPSPGIEPLSLLSPAGRFFTTSATWEALFLVRELLIRTCHALGQYCDPSHTNHSFLIGTKKVLSFLLVHLGRYGGMKQ